MTALKAVAGENVKRIANATGLTAIVFVTEKSPREIAQATDQLWREDGTMWILPIHTDDYVRLPSAAMDFVRRHT